MEMTQKYELEHPKLIRVAWDGTFQSVRVLIFRIVYRTSDNYATPEPGNEQNGRNVALISLGTPVWQWGLSAGTPALPPGDIPQILQLSA